MPKNIEQKALEAFRSGLNCAQSVVTAYADELNFNSEEALFLSCGFGGGMGRLQETCGAVTGSYMVLGVYNCRKVADNAGRKEATYSMVQKFSAKFNELNGTTNCRSLLNCDLRTEDGNRYAKENNLFGTICERCITDSVKIVNDLTDLHNK
jgi:C_GCAxxG_C_C family probable redox protein